MKSYGEFLKWKEEIGRMIEMSSNKIMKRSLKENKKKMK